MDAAPASHAAGQRLDKWLFFARLAKSRALAQKLTAAGAVRINGVKIDAPARPVRPGDALTLALARDVMVVRVLCLAERRGSATQARTLFEPVATSSDRPAT